MRNRRKKIAMPMLVVTGERASGDFLIVQAKLIADDVQGLTIPGAGHWLIDEAPNRVIPRVVEFLAPARATATQPR